MEKEIPSKDAIERLKSALFDDGRDAVEAFLGYKVDPGEDKDVTDKRMDLAIQEMSADAIERYCAKYDIE